MSARNVVGILQEHYAQQHKPPPHYEIFSIGDVHCPRFKCLLSTADGDKKIETEASSKKEAKNLAAAQAIEKLTFKDISRNNNSPLTDIKLSVSLPLSGSSSDNFIGLLNEYASKCRLLYPEYNEEKLFDDKFRVTCKFMNYMTQGDGRNKKTARQVAAEKMWTTVNNGPLPDLIAYEKAKPLNVNKEETEKFIQLFKELSTSEVGKSNQSKIGFEACPVKKEQVLTIDDLRTELKKYEVDFTITEECIDKHFILKIKRGDGMILMSTGGTKHEAIEKLLDMAIDVFQVPLDFNGDLIQF